MFHRGFKPHAPDQIGVFCLSLDGLLMSLRKIEQVILLTEKFLPFDWLRAEVFQLNLKYLRLTKG